VTPQYFKGDATEIKYYQSGSDIMDLQAGFLDEFFEGAFDNAVFLLMLYDEGRMPFSDRIPREAFISFLIECIANVNFIGSYESYIFLITRIFGAGSSVFFEETAPGVLTLTASATNTIDYDFVVREVIDGEYVVSELVTELDEQLIFAGFPGIESEAELNQLLSEFVPAGIYPDITLIIFSTSLFLVEESSVQSTIIDELNNDIIFFELGG
jgi:hypothetical protein